MSDHAVGQNVEETPSKRKCTGNSNEEGMHACILTAGRLNEIILVMCQY